MSKIRISGGEWRSRLIQVADAPGLRPTPDRVRETLFNWLGQDLRDLACLDMFAGSGILGIEAASRGARSVALVESARTTLLVLRKNVERFACTRLEIFDSDALEFARLMQRQQRQFDLIFLDPPYRQGWLERVIPLLEELATSGARLYVEAEAPLDKMGQLGSWEVVKKGKAGQVFFHLLERI